MSKIYTVYSNKLDMGAKSYKETEAQSEHFIQNTDELENGKSVT